MEAVEGGRTAAAGPETETTLDRERVRRWLTRTPIRVFLVYPALVVTARGITHPSRLKPVRWIFAPLLVWGVVQHRLVADYRTTGPGAAGRGNRRMPDRLVQAGPYAVVRNPIYLAHLIFAAGLALVFRSRVGAAILAGTAIWYQQRVVADEARLAEKFGAEYEAYRRRVRRWIPGLF
jgi:protein-S-isoprenylcysteine O-methyltransferase Ste14